MSFTCYPIIFTWVIPEKISKTMSHRYETTCVCGHMNFMWFCTCWNKFCRIHNFFSPYYNSSWLLKSNNWEISVSSSCEALGRAAGCFLTVLIAASLKAFVIVQAMRLDAVVSISFIHECHRESVSFLCPQDWTWGKTIVSRYEVSRWKTRHQCTSKWDILANQKLGLT